jgi:hypothetical protein
MFGGSPAVMISCGKYHTIVLTEEGWVWTCGAEENGRLGHGNEDDRFVVLVVITKRTKIVVVLVVITKRTKIVVIQEPSYGLLNFTEEDGWAINSTITGGVQALQTVQIASTAYINILQSQMLAIFASITAKSINAVYEWSTDGTNWYIVEPNKDINPTQGLPSKIESN